MQLVTIKLLHEYDPLPLRQAQGNAQPLSQNGRGESELALLPYV